MIRVAALTAVLLYGAPALAKDITVEFKRDSGEVFVAVFDDETRMVTMGEQTMPYTYDPEKREICASPPEGEKMCVVFAEGGEPVVGMKSAYTASNGNTGTATVTAISE